MNIELVIRQLWCKIKNLEKGGTGGEGTTEEFTVSKPAGSYAVGQIFPEGMTLAQAFRSLLTTISNTTFSDPYLTMKLSTTGLREMGETIPSLIITNTFNRGSINGGFDGAIWNPSKNMGPAVSLPTKHIIDGTTFNTSTEVQTKTIPNYVIPLGNTIFAGSVDYSAGTKPLNSVGEEQIEYPAGTKSATVSLTSILPYFYGFINENQTIDDINLANLTKAVATSTGTVTIPFSNVVGKKLVVIIPTTSTIKTKWYVNALNSGAIGGTGNLFSVTTKNYSSPNGLWGSTSFRVYLSTPTSMNDNVQFQN